MACGAAGTAAGAGAVHFMGRAQPRDVISLAARSHFLVTHRLAPLDDVRYRLLRHRNDASGDAPLRRGGLRTCAARKPPPVRCDDRFGHGLQQDGAADPQGLRPHARAALRLPWVLAPMAAATTTIPIRLFAASTAFFPSTIIFPAVRPAPKRCSTASCCCSGRSPHRYDEAMSASHARHSAGSRQEGALPPGEKFHIVSGKMKGSFREATAHRQACRCLSSHPRPGPSELRAQDISSGTMSNGAI